MTATTSAKTHWPGLDGLRGVAALVVVVFHVSLGQAVNGYAGVDVFFALSGFLITWLLLAERDRFGRVSLKQFYVRRLLRLYPALVATCLLVLGLAVVGGAVRDVVPGILAALGYVSNWWLRTGGEAPMLEHTWTLAIEEHYYLIWPLLITGFFARARWIRVLAVAVAAAGVVAVLVPWPGSVDGVRLSYVRGTPIVWGSLLAVAIRRGWLDGAARLLPWIGALSAVALLTLLVVPWPAPFTWMEGFTSIPGALSILVVAAIVVVPGSLPWLAWAPLVWAGRRSYGIYLYHFPLLSLLRHHVDVGSIELRMAVGVVATLVVAALSYHFVEKPFLRMKDRFHARPVSQTT
ncbi:acyltransferase family protein [Ornithinimicrobium cerasi]|uniref:Peptidoglycan/LPS O-acetylase OafA/YrhL, contains acyltransferase and SGNH-hydrolase domains n=1 Tax=Ornithinimicrobium cerasi TaxID=2248773 RepID=A0A285VYI4_9MICO|nr:acyltransferase [Ornithinimicrobium cerasi]SOC58326.1 Peptidoglycan/LPS O-acetylase OafA/YrhL, contains acyltransferase and SGNH-hydrolase domains [Ornithinimicrobium cerasi]